jgi:hypothetical protein
MTEIITDLNLDNLKVGTEIVTIRVTSGKRVYGGVRIITGLCERNQIWRYAKEDNLKKNIGVLPSNGLGWDFMSKRKEPDFYYSANPRHIEEAKKQHEEAKIKREEVETEKARRMALAFPIGNLLKTEYYDSEENYHLDSTNDIAEILVARLTDEQILTLKDWLSIEK